MKRLSFANAVAGIGLLLAVAAVVFLASWAGFYHGVTVNADGQVVRRASASLIEQNGMGVLWMLVLPVILSAAGFVASFWRTGVGKVATWASAILLLSFGLLTWIDFGPFYLPSALALVIAAASLRTATNGRPSPRLRPLA